MGTNEVFAKRLKMARVIKGYSMDKLIEKMNPKVSKMSISKYESGEMLPDSSILISLSKALEQNIDWFFSPLRVSIQDVNFRKRSTLNKKMEDSIKQEVIEFAERYIEIENISSIPQFNISKRENSVIKNESDVISFAGEISNKWNIGDDGISCVMELLEEHGIKICEIDTNQKFDGLSANLGEYGAVIVVNKNFSSERKRFTALHELGHLILNFDSSIQQIEKMCNLFASEMLISRKKLKDFLGESRKAISYQELQSIQAQYGISIDALIYKAKESNIITENHCNSYFKRKNADKAFKKFVEKSIYPQDTGSRFKRLVYKALSSNLISESKAASLLNIPRNRVIAELALI